MAIQSIILSKTEEAAADIQPWNDQQQIFTRLSHYENTPIQIYRKASPPNTENFQIKKL